MRRVQAAVDAQLAILKQCVDGIGKDAPSAGQVTWTAQQHGGAKLPGTLGAPSKKQSPAAPTFSPIHSCEKGSSSPL